MSKPIYLTPEEVAERLKVHCATVARWCRTGALKAFKVGKLWRIDEDDLTRFKKQNAKAVQEPGGN